MWNNTSTVLLGILLSAIPSAGTVWGNSFSFGAHTVLVYGSDSGDQKSQLVFRLARYHPDVFMEWESRVHQGTLHLFEEAVGKGKKFTLTHLFDAGVDIESKDVMTVWISKWMYDELTNEGSVKIKSNRLPLTMRVEGKDVHTLALNRRELELPVLRLKDSRGGSWAFHEDRDNPVLMEYVLGHYRLYLKSVSTSRKSLRWIRKLPPVK